MPEIRNEEPIARHLPLRAGESFEAWAEAADEAGLVALVRWARAEKMTIRPVPPFAAALPPDGGLTGLGLRLGAHFEQMREDPEGLWVGASVPLALVGLRRGFESFAGAPGTLSDALEDGWVVPAVVRVRRYKGRGFEEGEPVADAKTLPVAALLKPGAKVSPPRAGEAFRPIKKRNLRDLLRSQGLAGLRLGDAALAEDDPLVLVNRGQATAKQLRLLMQAVRERVHTATGLTVEDRIAPVGRGGRL